MFPGERKGRIGIKGKKASQNAVYRPRIIRGLLAHHRTAMTKGGGLSGEHLNSLQVDFSFPMIPKKKGKGRS